MKNDPAVKDFDGRSAGLYPHLKIMAEEFPPRPFDTTLRGRRGRDHSRVFDATSAILIDLTNRVFRLRSCDIPMTGIFPFHARSIITGGVWHHACESMRPRGLSRDGRSGTALSANRRGELIEALRLRIQLASARWISKRPPLARHFRVDRELLVKAAMECLDRR